MMVIGDMTMYEDALHPDSHIEGDLMWCISCDSLVPYYVDMEEEIACRECGWQNVNRSI